MVNMDKLSAKICMPFGAETMENDPCTVETTGNYNAGTGTRQDTSAQVKERNRQAFQRRIAQQKSRIHAAEPNTFKFSGAEHLFLESLERAREIHPFMAISYSSGARADWG